jgi:prevent-host-death family protein
MVTINVFDAKSQFSKLIARAEAGEEVVITRHGRPVARLVAMPTERADRVPGWLESFDIPVDFDSWTDADERDWFGEEVEQHHPAS